MDKEEEKMAAKKAVDLEYIAKVYNHEEFVDLTAQGLTDIIGRMTMGADGLGESNKVTIDDKETGIKHIYIYALPDNQKPKEIDASRGEPAFSEVDNPGKWPD